MLIFCHRVYFALLAKTTAFVLVELYVCHIHSCEAFPHLFPVAREKKKQEALQHTSIYTSSDRWGREKCQDGLTSVVHFQIQVPVSAERWEHPQSGSTQYGLCTLQPHWLGDHQFSARKHPKQLKLTVGKKTKSWINHHFQAARARDELCGASPCSISYSFTHKNFSLVACSVQMFSERSSFHRHFLCLSKAQKVQYFLDLSHHNRLALY